MTMPDSVTLADLVDLPEVVRRLKADVDELKARVAEHQLEALLDVAGAADLLHMTPAAVRSAAYRGTLPCVKVGSRLRFRPSELLRA
jgi:Helix-turn-helix domain